MDDARSRRESRIAIALCAFAYLYVFPYQASINNPNENVRFYMTAALAEHGTYVIDELRERWGKVNDAAIHDGHAYSVKAPGASFLAVPGYALYYYGVHRLFGREFDRTEALWVCRVTAVVLPTLLFLYFFHRYLSRLGYSSLLTHAAFFSAALGSLLYGYGMLLVSHTLSAVAAFSAFMLLSACREPGGATPARALGAGLAAAAVTAFEYPGLPCSVVLSLFAIYVLWKQGGVRLLAAFTAGGLVPTLAMMHFQWRAFGNPLSPGHLMTESQYFNRKHHEGFYGAVGPNAEAFHGLLVDLTAGLLPLTPVLVLAPVGLYFMLRDRDRRPEAVCAGAVLFATIFAIGSLNNWRGGWTIGPRFLALCVPFGAMLALIALGRWERRTKRLAQIFAIGSTAAAMVASGLPSAYYPHLPPQITRPLSQLFAVLIRHGYAPPNAGELFSLHGGASMLPLLACALGALWLCLRGAAGARERMQVGTGALLCALGLLFPLVRPIELEPKERDKARDAVAFVTRHYQPKGRDRAARLAAKLRAQPNPSASDLKRLARLYTAEGRIKEAEAARNGNP